MFDSTIIKVDSFVSKKSGKPFKIVWFNNEFGIPCKTFASGDFNGVIGDKVQVVIEPGFDCTARIELIKA